MRKLATLCASAVVLAGLILSPSGCSTTAANAEAKQDLIYAVDIQSYIETGTAQDAVLLKFDKLKSYLEKETGKKVSIFSVTEQAAITEGLRAKKADYSAFSPYRYVLADKRVEMEPIAFRGDAKTGKVSTYYSYMIASPASGLTSLDDVKKRSHELSIAFQDPASTSGSFIPKVSLIKAGVNPDKDFKEVISGGEDVTVTMAVKSGKTDLAAVSNSFYEQSINKGVIKPEDVKIVFKSEPILSGVVGIRAEIDPKLKQALQKAYFEMDKKDPEALAVASGSAWGGGSPYIYLPTDENMTKMLKEYSEIAKQNGL